MSAAAVVEALVGGAAILAAVLFAVFAVRVVGGFFEARDAKRKAVADERAARAVNRHYYRTFDMGRFGQTMSDMEADAEDDVEDDSPLDDADFLEDHT